MIIVMSHLAAPAQVEAVVERVKEIGLRPEVSRGEDRAVIGVIGGNAYAYREAFSHLPGIQEILQITKPFKLASGLEGLLGRVRAATDLPVAAGFGISRPEHIRALRGHADAAVVASALLERVHRGEDPVPLVEELLAACR